MKALILILAAALVAPTASANDEATLRMLVNALADANRRLQRAPDEMREHIRMELPRCHTEPPKEGRGTVGAGCVLVLVYEACRKAGGCEE